VAKRKAKRKAKGTGDTRKGVSRPKKSFRKPRKRDMPITIPRSKALDRRKIEYELKPGQGFWHGFTSHTRKIKDAIRELEFEREDIAGQWQMDMQFHVAWRDKKGQWRNPNGKKIKRPKYAKRLTDFPKRKTPPKFNIDRRIRTFGIGAPKPLTAMELGNQVNAELENFIRKVIDSNKFKSGKFPRVSITITLDSATLDTRDRALGRKIKTRSKTRRKTRSKGRFYKGIRKDSKGQYRDKLGRFAAKPKRGKRGTSTKRKLERAKGG